MADLKSAVLFIVLLFAVNIFSQNTNRYGFNSAYVEKTSKTSTAGTEVTTQEKIYILGNKEARYITETTNLSMMGQDHSNITKKVIITDPEWIRSYNPETREGTKMKNNFTDKFSGMSEDEMKQMAEQMGDALDTEVTEAGTGTVANKECKITIAETDLMGMKTTSKIWSYKNFQMKTESNTSGTTVNEVVTKFEEDAKIDPDKLIVPSDVNMKVMESSY
jgi:hypothetical protein